MTVTGIVQGVGFRPFVFRLATRHGLAGSVRNDASGVTIEVEGTEPALAAFLRELVEHAPPLARIETVSHDVVEPLGEEGFSIVRSVGGARAALISPDVGTCRDCLDEISDPGARRYRYPFTNCTNCGPRFTITLDIPYDRANTTMAGFEMCPACRAEYEDPSDRRFHAQPIACPACGPQLRLLSPATLPPAQATGPSEAIDRCAALLAEGRIVAIKGLGGYHLACDAANQEAVAGLRRRKVREDKPFALMASDPEVIRGICEISAHEESLLLSHRRPVVLLRRRLDPVLSVAPSVAPGNRFLGIMLPYTPLHHLLLASFDGTLVMTSGNLSDEPIAYLDGDAAERLSSITEDFLVHDRPIHVRCDDSVTRSFRGREYLLRRSRGYAPEPLLLSVGFPRPVLAVGAELKHTFCLGKDRRALLSHHIGDLENWETMRSFLEGVEHFSRTFQVQPEVIAHDLHPEYLATKWAIEQAGGEAEPLPGLDLEGADLIGVQHHHAHVASCLADNQVGGPVIGLALDGTGWGTDATIWGCEVLVADLSSFQRVGHLRSVPLASGTAAIKEPWRMAAVYLAEAYGPDAWSLPIPFVQETARRWAPILDMARKGLNSLPTTSAGRLFDAAAALAGLRSRVNYEGQAAVELEQAADPADTASFPCGVARVGETFVIDGVELIRWIAEDLKRGEALPRIAAAFHNGFAKALVQTCMLVREVTGLGEVALSGGTFQNLLLAERVTAGLEAAGFTVHRHRKVPPNDGGISLGQAAIAAARMASS
ncbi:MAG: carbamoyltransferase HypF [Actinomycetota bacterium]